MSDENSDIILKIFLIIISLLLIGEYYHIIHYQSQNKIHNYFYANYSLLYNYINESVYKNNIINENLSEILYAYNIPNNIYYIYSCGYNITKPGIYYIENNLYVNSEDCIQIYSNNVYIDGNGYKLISNGNGIGIYYSNISEIKNIIIQNLSLYNFNGSDGNYGILLESIGNSTISNVLLNNLEIYNSNNAINILSIANSDISDNPYSTSEIENISIFDIEIYNTEYAINISAYYGYNGANINNNYIENIKCVNSNYCIYIYGFSAYDNVYIYGNIFSNIYGNNSEYYIYIWGGTSIAFVYDNIFNNIESNKIIISGNIIEKAPSPMPLP